MRRGSTASDDVWLPLRGPHDGPDDDDDNDGRAQTNKEPTLVNLLQLNKHPEGAQIVSRPSVLAALAGREAQPRRGGCRCDFRPVQMLADDNSAARSESARLGRQGDVFGGAGSGEQPRGERRPRREIITQLSASANTMQI